MKAIIISLFVTLLSLSAGTQAQTIKVTQCQALIANNTNNALTVNIPETDYKSAVEAWRKLMKKYGSRMAGETEYLAEKARIREISPDLIDIYAVFKQKEGFVEMIVGFKTGTGFVNSATTPVAYSHAEKILHDFAVDHARKVLKKKVSKEKSALKKISREKKKLERNTRSLNRSIEKYKSRIEKAKERIEANEQSSVKISGKLEEAKTKVEIYERKLKEIK